MDFTPIPSQTVGPFFHLGCTEQRSCGCLVGEHTRGDRIRLEFEVLDGEGAPVDDAMIEIWQADAHGNYAERADAHSGKFTGFGRLATDAKGRSVFETIRPGRVAGVGDKTQAPHINVSVFARGLLQRLVTRAYFAGDPANQEDSVLALVPSERSYTLMAQPRAGGDAEWTLTIRLSGENETVFFDV